MLKFRLRPTGITQSASGLDASRPRGLPRLALAGTHTVSAAANVRGHTRSAAGHSVSSATPPPLRLVVVVVLRIVEVLRLLVARLVAEPLVREALERPLGCDHVCT